LPFFRSHAHVDSPRREPWLLPQPHAAHALEALRERQRLLPFWYTLCWDAASGALPSAEGLPLVRPLWLGSGGGGSPPASPAGAGKPVPRSALLLADTAFTVGADLLVFPVATKGASNVEVPLPVHGCGGAPCEWFSVSSGARLRGGFWHSEPVGLGSMPRYQRGGSILPRRERVRRSALLAVWDPISLHAALDAAGHAAGRLYLDDGVTARLPAALHEHQQSGGLLEAARAGAATAPESELEGAPPQHAARSAGVGVGALLLFNVTCEEKRSAQSTDGGGGGHVVRCILSSRPTRPLALGESVGPLPASVYVERVLLRGLSPLVVDQSTRLADWLPSSLAPGSGKRPTASVGGAAPRPLGGKVEATPHGLLLERLHLPCDEAWDIEVPGAVLDG